MQYSNRRRVDGVFAILVWICFVALIFSERSAPPVHASNITQPATPTGPAGGDLGGTYPNPTVVQVNGAAIPASALFTGTNSSRQLTALTAASATAALNAFTSSLQGLAPASGGGSSNFLRADGTWAIPAGSGTVSCGGLPALTGDTTSAGGTCATSTVAVNGGAIPASALFAATNSSRQFTALTAASATAALNAFTSSLQGLAPASGGGTTNFLRADGNWAAPSGSSNSLIRTVGAGFDGAGSPLISGSTKTTYFTVPFACTIAAWNITVDTGTITFDVWKIGTGTAIPTVANTIVASAAPAISTGTAVHSTTLTGWTTSVAANDIFGININTVASATKASLTLQCNAT